MKTVNKGTTEKLTKTGYAIKPMTNENAESAVDLFTRAFCDSEPMTKYLTISHEDYMPFATDVIKKAVHDGLSTVALDRNNKVIALIISEDIADTFEPNFSAYPKLKPIYSLLGQLSKPFLETKSFKKGKVLHTWIAATVPEHRSQGIIVDLVSHTVDSGLKKGFEFIYAEFTNTISENVTHQFKVLQLCNTLPYENFIFEGKKPLKGLQGRAASYIATLNPNSKLDSLQNCYTVKESVPQQLP